MVPAAGDILFVDTNVLLTATDESRPQHRDAGRLFGESGLHGLHLAASGQILREYLVVATRPPDTNGLGLHAFGRTVRRKVRSPRLRLRRRADGSSPHCSIPTHPSPASRKRPCARRSPPSPSPPPPTGAT